MQKGYGQYCPLALASELLCQRWTVLVISRLLDGFTTFNAIHQGVPRISPSLLSQRLSELEHYGILKRRKQRGQRGYTYHLTEAGRELEPIVDMMAVWGHHWARDNTAEDLDLGFLAWSMHLRMNTGPLPKGRTVFEFQFSGAPVDGRQFWIVATDGEVDMCMKHPGFDTDLLVKSDLRRFVEAWRGFRDMHQEIRAGRIKLTGPSALKKVFPECLLLSMFADYERKRTGRERRLKARRKAG